MVSPHTLTVQTPAPPTVSTQTGTPQTVTPQTVTRQTVSTSDTAGGPIPWTTVLAWVQEGRHVVVPAPGGAVVCLSEAAYADLVARAGARSATAGTPGREAPRLTARELEILRAVRVGGTGAEIADRMGLATNTVAQHLHSVRRKYAVGSTAEAIARAEQAGIL